MTITETYFEKYKEKYGSFKVATQVFGDNRLVIWKHFKYPSKEYDSFFSYPNEDATDREIFKDEIVIEGDLPFRRLNLNSAVIIQLHYLDTKELSYEKWYCPHC